MSGPGPGDLENPQLPKAAVPLEASGRPDEMEPTSPKESCPSAFQSEDWLPTAIRTSLGSQNSQLEVVAKGIRASNCSQNSVKSAEGRRDTEKMPWSDAASSSRPSAATRPAPAIAMQHFMLTSHLEQLGSLIQHWQNEHFHILRNTSGLGDDSGLVTRGIELEIPDERLDHVDRIGDGSGVDDGAVACGALNPKFHSHQAATPVLHLANEEFTHVTSHESHEPSRRDSTGSVPDAALRPSVDSALQGWVSPPPDARKSNYSGRFASFLGSADVRAAREASSAIGGGLSRQPARLFASVLSSVPKIGTNWRSEACPGLDTLVKAIERDKKFEALSFAIIGANAISLTLSTELAATYQEPSQACLVIEDICFWFYIIELLIREKLFENSGMNLSYVRIVRLLKVLKVLRIIRLLRFFKELRLILGAMASSLKSIMWACSMVASVTFMFSICFVQGMTGFPQEQSPHMPGWSTVAEGMLTLFMAGTGGVDWWGAILPLFMAGWLYVGVFIFYIVFFFFVIQNTITSLFVECLLDRQNNDEALIIQERLERKNDYMAKIQQLFNHMDNEGKGSVTYEQLNDNINHPTMISFSTSLEMEEADLRMFFTILTGSGKQRVDLETFVVGCIKLRGNAKSIDLVDLMLKLKRMVAQQDKQATQIENHWAQCKNELRALRHMIVPANTSTPSHFRRSQDL